MPCPRFALPDDFEEPEIAGFAVLFDGDIQETFESLGEAISHAKEISKERAIDDEMNFEIATIEIVYETDIDCELIWDNVLYKTIEYDRKLNNWEIK